MKVIDCDIHPSLAHAQALHPYLSAHWREHLAEYGSRAITVYAGRGSYPRYNPNTARLDSWPPNGQPPGSDLAFMQQQHLDPMNVEFAVMQPLVGANTARNLDLATAMTHAVNEWQLDEFSSRDGRLKASIQVAPDDAEGAVAEINLRAADPRFVQIQFGSLLLEPAGRKRYWPIYAAAAANGLPIGFHIGGATAHSPTPGGWPSFYAEDHQILTHSMQTQVASLILEGVFEEFPELRVVMIEAGFAWAPPLGWRLDRNWKIMRRELPRVKRPPSDYLRSNVWFTSQPIEEPEQQEDLRTLMDWVGWDRVMFSSDYPHWDFDDHNRIFPIRLSAEQKNAIFRENAARFYRVQ